MEGGSMIANLYEALSEKRKQLQQEDLVPQWYSTAAYQLFSQKYEYETHGRSVRGQFERIAKTAAKHLKGTKWENIAEQKFFDLMWNGWLSPSTPVLANMGTNRGLPVSCSGGYVHDSINGFYTSRHEVAMLTKNGFGTSSYLGSIRPRGSDISVGGKASGVVPVFKGFVQDMRDVAQGTARRGAWAGYLEIDHGDFDELVDHITAEPDDANVGWIITNVFLERLKSGDEEAIRRYQKAMKFKMVTGKGYFFFPDKANAKRPESYVKNNLTVKASNLCLTGDTLVDIETESGKHLKITLDILVSSFNVGAKFKVKSLNIDTHEIEYKQVTAAALTAKSAKLMKITDNETGKSIRCTPDHKIFTENRGYVEAKNLLPDDILNIQ